MRPHVHVPAPDDDVLGTASACCPLPAGNTRVHITHEQLAEQIPAIDWHDTDREEA